MEDDRRCIIPTQFVGIDLQWTDEKKEEYAKANQWRKETVLNRKMKEIMGNPKDMAIVREFPNYVLATCSRYLTGVIVMIREYLQAKYPYSHKTRNIALKLHWISQLKDRILGNDWLEICQIAEQWYNEVKKAKAAKKDFRLSELLSVTGIRAFYHQSLSVKVTEIIATPIDFDEDVLEGAGNMDNGDLQW